MKNKITEKKIAEETESKRKKELAEEIKKDFESRKEARRSIEQGWRINMNFVSGNQYCFVSHAGNLETEVAAVLQPYRPDGGDAYRATLEGASRAQRACLFGRGSGHQYGASFVEYSAFGQEQDRFGRRDCARHAVVGNVGHGVL